MKFLFDLTRNFISRKRRDVEFLGHKKVTGTPASSIS